MLMNRERLFEEYINENLNNIYRFAFMYTKNQQDAEDVVSESVIKALKSLRSLRRPEAMKSWFYTIIVNTARTLFAQKGDLIYLETDDLDSLDMVYAEHYDDYSALELEDIVQKLSPELRVIIVLRFFEDLTLKQIADVLNVKESTVKKRFYTALKILHNEMEEYIK